MALIPLPLRKQNLPRPRQMGCAESSASSPNEGRVHVLLEKDSSPST